MHLTFEELNFRTAFFLFYIINALPTSPFMLCISESFFQHSANLTIIRQIRLSSPQIQSSPLSQMSLPLSTNVRCGDILVVQIR